ncbi:MULTISPECIES: rhamnulokinase family protein [unclassified Actinomyces]|uniref:rhamnulokinase n=1 Tax=unclassified Actinomyces TaxID=2609248 RepID=UPI000D5A10F8|nr:MULTISPECIES: FGGY-family carbohydrate kinase [unclassified Actinomyces]RAX22010.1 carbohydrate kinase [Actinomyces sp. Z3]RAX24102.1 carbohydrate kinase [Actinomyces sp. Z5]
MTSTGAHPNQESSHDRRHDALALDLGSSSVRGVLGRYQDGVVTTQEVHRTHHQVMERDGYLTWDLALILEGVRRSIEAATTLTGRLPDSIGTDTWGVDYGLLGTDGTLLRAPRAYRDARSSRWAAELDARLDPAAAWRATGVLPQQINTIYQLFADLREEPDLTDRVGTLLPLPDLIAHLMGAPAKVGRTIASTTGLARPGADAWSQPVLMAAGIPMGWLPEIVDDATLAGRTAEGIDIVRPGGHDTACAVHVLGLGPEEVRMFISSGSWSLVGATLPEPVVTDAARRAGLTNEVRTDGGVRLLRNLTGFWLLQECQRAWDEEDTQALLDAASEVHSLGAVIDPDDPAFVRPGRMPDKIANWCLEHYGLRPTDRAQTVRLILESLACAHANYAYLLHDVVGDRLDPAAPIHLVGGGARNTLLVQMTASACHRPVIAGPTEASALGNILAQLEATGVIAPSERADVIARSVSPQRIEPGDAAPFDAMRERLRSATASCPSPTTYPTTR